MTTDSVPADELLGMFCGDPGHECSWCIDRQGVLHGQPGHEDCKWCRDSVPTIYVDEHDKIVGAGFVSDWVF